MPKLVRKGQLKGTLLKGLANKGLPRGRPGPKEGPLEFPVEFPGNWGANPSYYQVIVLLTCGINQITDNQDSGRYKPLSVIRYLLSAGANPAK